MKRIILPLFVIGLLCLSARANSADLIITSAIPSVSSEGGRQTNHDIFDQSLSLFDFTQAFGSITGDYNYTRLWDVDRDDDVDGQDIIFTHNKAIGYGGNPAQSGTPGGGSGGAIYNDGLTMTLSLCGTRIEHNEVNAYGSAIFFVSNNHDGTIQIEDTIIRNNFGGVWELLPGISAHSDTTLIIDEDSIIE